MKTPKAIGLAAALAALVLVPAAAVSQGKKDADIPAAARKSGMAEAPALVQAAGLPCQVSDARKIGEDKKTKTGYYEVACATGTMGYVLQSSAGAAPTVFTCIEANTPPGPDQKPSAPCLLPGNADPKAVLTPLIQQAGVQCLPEQARGIGQTKTATYIEVACQAGDGYIVSASAPFDGSKPVQAQNCLLYDDAETNIKCTLTDRAKRLAVVDTLAQSANNGCQVKDRRFLGAAKDNSQYFEASCQDGKGYIYKVANGKLSETYECAKASHLLGGCTLTDARQAATEQAALYTRLAKGAGSNCEVDRYALFPPRPGEEIVEMVCKDGKGAIGMFKAGGTGSQVLDCGRAPIAGYKCSLSKDAGYSNLTADLKKFNFNSCDVSDSRVIGKSEKGTTFVEVACADGLKGYVIEYQSAPKVQAVNALGCAFAGNCKLKGNT
ncbi:hypothetical protein LRS10_03335 [Phenylobacterium sp. J426]|uniref:hypothetical protein n=1 Tax=Phenylobacterium sp. J426 TaxID=2898439 RepID=UPI00215114A3|nr:hypothetical protein [Phenylobacterium sp. J426]MCR5873307.1 hypothetical protein [Phenylobacterium sp. J426]